MSAARARLTASERGFQGWALESIPVTESTRITAGPAFGASPGANSANVATMAIEAFIRKAPIQMAGNW